MSKLTWVAQNGDRFRVQKTGTVIEYLKNSVVFYTSTNAVGSKLYADASLSGVGATLHNVYTSFGCLPTFFASSRSNTNTDLLLSQTLVADTITKATVYNDVKVYPNPTNGQFVLEFKGELNSDAQASIFNSIGQLVMQKAITNTITDFDLSQQPNGLYFIKLKTDKGEVSLKLVKQ